MNGKLFNELMFAQVRDFGHERFFNPRGQYVARTVMGSRDYNSERPEMVMLALKLLQELGKLMLPPIDSDRLLQAALLDAQLETAPFVVDSSDPSTYHQIIPYTDLSAVSPSGNSFFIVRVRSACKKERANQDLWLVSEEWVTVPWECRSNLPQYFRQNPVSLRSPRETYRYSGVLEECYKPFVRAFSEKSPEFGLMGNPDSSLSGRNRKKEASSV